MSGGWQQRVCVAIGAAAALFKLSLLRSQHIYAIGTAPHDDALFMKLAAFISRGEWLGPYDMLTLAKGPAYSAFIAATFWLGLPLALMQQLLYVAACGVAVAALRPWVRSPWARLLAFVFLVFNPLTMEGETMTRIMRQHLTIPLGLMMAASAVALVARREATDGAPARWPWALLLGSAGGVFWLSREDGVWILPLVALTAVALTIEAWRRGRPALRRWGGLVGLATGAALAPILTVCALNAHYYGWFGTVEFRADAFKDAHGALLRVRVGPDLPYAASTREAREAIYAVSPAFAELRPHLDDSDLAARWLEKDRYPIEAGVYTSGWFMWGLRDAIAAAGHAGSARAFLDYCRRLADEINAACDDGRLPADGRRSGFLPRWHSDYGAALRADAWPFLREAMRKTGIATIVPPSQGTDDDIRHFVDLSYDNLSPSYNATYFHRPDQLRVNRVKLDTLAAMGNALRRYFYVVFWVAIAVVVVRLGESLWRRRFAWPLLMTLAVAGTVLAQVAVNLAVHVMAFPNLHAAAYSPSYPLLQYFAVLAAIDAIRAWAAPARAMGRRLRPGAAAPTA